MKPNTLWRSATALLVPMLAGCQSSSDAWQQDVSELVAQGNAVIDSVASLPECATLRQGGLIHWRATVPPCPPYPGPVVGCARPDQNPRRVDVIFESAWNATVNPDKSTLAHELCHLCGYTDEREAEACAQRSHAYFTPLTESVLSPARGAVDARSRAEEAASLVASAGLRAADSVRHGERGEAREILQAALRAISEPALADE